MRKFLLALALCGAAPGWAQAEWVRATVVKADAARARLTLKHDAIKSLPMEAMTMQFKVKDPALLARLKPGDKVRFTAALLDDELIVTAIRAVP